MANIFPLRCFTLFCFGSVKHAIGSSYYFVSKFEKFTLFYSVLEDIYIYLIYMLYIQYIQYSKYVIYSIVMDHGIVRAWYLTCWDTLRSEGYHLHFNMFCEKEKNRYGGRV